MLEIQILASAAVEAALAGRNLNDHLASTWRQSPQLSSAERGAVQDLSFGTLRFYGLLDAILRQLQQKPIPDARLHALLVVALYQLEFSRAKPFAIVDHAVAATAALGKPAAKGLTNAILRNYLRRREALCEQAAKDEVARFNHPHWWIDKVRAQFPDRWQSVLEAANRPPPMTLRVNLRRTTPPDYLQRLNNLGMSGSILGAAALRLSQPVPVSKLPGFAQGDVSVQDASAQHGAILLDLANGMHVLDACSAPGGKASHILETADVYLLALDSNPARLERVADNLARLQLTAELRLADAAGPANWWDGRPFDRILIDTPCTGSGVVRRHPDIKWARRPSDIGQFVAQQYRLLEALWPTLRLGGKLLYATCSVFHEENHEQIAAFLSRHRDAQCLPLANLNTQDGQILPDDAHDGFFYALLAKA